MAFKAPPSAGTVILDTNHILFSEGPWREVAKGYKQGAGGEVIESVRVFDIPWDIKDWWEAQALGWTDYDFDLGEGPLSPAAQRAGQSAVQQVILALERHTPWQHPIKPYLYASKVDLIDGIGVPGTDLTPANQSIIQYYNAGDDGMPTNSLPGSPGYVGPPLDAGYARLAVTFSPRPYDILSDAQAASAFSNTSGTVEMLRYVERKRAYSVENLKLHAQTLQITVGADTVKIPDFSYLPYPTIQYTYIWRGIPALPRLGYQACVGLVNENSFDPQYENLAPGTVMCLAPEDRQYRGLDGRKLFDVSLRFAYRPEGWNNFFYKGAFKSAVYTQDSLKHGQPPFQTAFFQSLFTLYKSDLDSIG